MSKECDTEVIYQLYSQQTMQWWRTVSSYKLCMLLTVDLQEDMPELPDLGESENMSYHYSEHEVVRAQSNIATNVVISGVIAGLANRKYLAHACFLDLVPS